MGAIKTFFNQNWARLQQAALFQPNGNVTFGNSEFEKASFRVLIVRLSPFMDVERSTPHLFLFQAARRVIPDAYIDMSFFPPQYDRERFLENDIPLLTGTQSWQPPSAFDVILISNAYTLELINLPYLFIHSGIPVLESERDESHPPIILGGSNALATQMIIRENGDCFADAIFFGEGEREVEVLVQNLYEYRSLPKRDRLQRTANRTTGLWVASGSLNTTVQKARCSNPTASDMLTQYPLLNGDEADVARMQITFGCPAFCSFCFEGYDRKQYRELSTEDVWATALDLKRENGPATLDLVSFNFNTYASILPLLLRLSHLCNRVSYKSQRVDVLTAIPQMLDAELLAGKRSYTVGIEGISERMRTFLHKSLSDLEIDNLIERMLQLNVREIKLFFILTGHETVSDIEEFRQFLRILKSYRSDSRRSTRIVFSFGLLIRMPFTPLRYDRLFLDEADWREITGQVKSACETNGFEFRLATPWPDYATSQVLAVGGYWLWQPVLALAQKGYCYDTALDEEYWNFLKNWMQDNGYWTSEFLNEKDKSTVFPLDFVQQHVTNAFLYQKYLDATSGIDTGYCLGEIGPQGYDATDARCFGCGACTSAEERTTITGHEMEKPGAHYLHELSEIMDRKRHLKPHFALLWLPPMTVGKTAAWRNAWVMRELFKAMPTQVENIIAVQESLFSTKDNARRYAGLYGETVFSILAWDYDALAEEITRVSNLKMDVRFMRWVTDFTPGEFNRASLTITLPTHHFADAGHQLRKYLQDQYVPVNLRRIPEGYLFDVPKKAMQKRVLYAGWFSQTESTFQGSITVSRKFNVRDYLASFAAPYWIDEAIIEVKDLEL